LFCFKGLGFGVGDLCCFMNIESIGCFVNIILLQGLGFGASDMCVVLWALDLQGVSWTLQIWCSI
jgi:hypothetical protein